MSTNRMFDDFDGGTDFFSDEDLISDDRQNDFDAFDRDEFDREFGELHEENAVSSQPVFDNTGDEALYDDLSIDEPGDGHYEKHDDTGYYDDEYNYGCNNRYDDDYGSSNRETDFREYSYAPQDDFSWGDEEQYENNEPASRRSIFDRLAGLSKGKRIALASVLLTLLLIVNIVAAGLSYFNRLMDGFDYEHDDEPYVVSFGDQPIADEGEDLQEGVSYTDVDEEQLMASINEVTVGEDNLFHQDGTTNILLLGTDARKKDGFARSDAIILLSVNRNTKQIVMTSFLRDTAVVFEGADYSDKLTHGYGYGKGPLMVKTIQSHFGVKIDYYMAIDFFAFIDVVDYLGGIELDINDDERIVMNNYIKEINDLQGILPDDGFLWKTGTVTVTGKQALGYARNRYSKSGPGTGDFGRSARQRIVLSAIIDKLKADPTKALGLLETIAPEVKTDYTKEALTAEVTNALEYLSYEIITTRVPADDTWHYGNRNGKSMVICDFEANQKLMIKTIYGVEMENYLHDQN